MYTRFSIASATLHATAAVFCCALLVCLAPAPATAQFGPPRPGPFVCDSATPGGAAGATATGSETVVCGSNAGQSSNGRANSAFGTDAGQSVIGNSNSAFGVGAGSSVTGSSNAAFGNAAGRFVAGNENAAFGNAAGTFVTGSDNTAFGNFAGTFVTGSDNVAIGRDAGRGVGPDADSLAVSNTVAIGNTAIARADGGVAIGNQSQTNGLNSVAVGAATNAGHENSAAFGSGATTTRANQQVFGTASNTYTLSGVASSASRAAQSGPVQVVTSDSGGNLATASLSELGLASIGDINAINARLSDLTKELRRGIAATAALAIAMTPSAPGKTTVSVNSGFFKGETGMGVALAHRLNVSTPFILHGSYANAGGNGHVGRVGFGFEF